MLSFTRCFGDHIRYIEPQPRQEREKLALLAPEVGALIDASVGLSAWSGGVCIGAAGILPYWRGRYTAWALLSRHVGPWLPAIVRKMRVVLDTHKDVRVEIVVLSDFEQGHRLARMLGFTCETPNGMRKYFPDGSDGVLYSRVG